MKSKALITSFLTLAICSVLAQPVQFNTPHHHEEIAFRPNQGQWEGEFTHVIHTPRYAAYLTGEGFTIAMSPVEALQAHHEAYHQGSEELPPVPVFAFSWKFIGHNANAETNGMDPTGPLRSYFIGEEENWVSGLKDAKRVRKTEVYPLIDVEYKLHPKNHLEYDFILAPGADPEDIRWELSGVDASIDEGELRYETPYGIVKEFIPEAYQLINGRKRLVEVAYTDNGKIFGFEVGEYDPTEVLIIDPVIVGATLTGSTGASNYGHGATYDQEGNIFSFGIGFGAGLPTTDGAIQENYEGTGGVNAVLNKFNPDASEQIFATYLGKNGTYPHSAATNLFGDVFLFGSTGDQTFPTLPGCVQSTSGGGTDIFISRVSPDGTELIASTYLGGSGEDGLNPITTGGYDGRRGEVSLDFEGNVYLASSSASSDFPVTSSAFSTDLNGNYDGVCAKLSPDLAVLSWSTFIGGSGDDCLLNVRIAENGNVVYSGSTRSDDYPTTAGVYQENGGAGDSFDADAVLGVLSPDGSELEHATYVATSQPEQGYFMDLDNDDNIWIYGSTQGGDDWPITDGVYSTDAKALFITQFEPDLSEIIVSTAIGAEGFFGGSASGGNPVAFLVDRCDRVYISAYGAAADLPLTDDALFTTGGFYLAAFEDELQTLSFATYYTENHVDGGTSRFDKKGVVYQGVCSGGGFNTTDDAFATDQNTGWDVGVFKIDFQLSGVNAAFSAPSELDGCAPHEISFSNFSVGDTFEWDFGDGTTSTEFEPTHVFEEPGNYIVTMIASDSLSCNLADTVSLAIDIFSPEDFQPGFDIQFDCETSEATLLNTTGGDDFLDFYWIINGDTLYTTYNATHQFSSLSGEQSVSLLAIDEGCEIDEAVTENLSGLVDVEASAENLASTECSLTVQFENSSVNATEYFWDFGDGFTSTEENPVHTFADYGTYDVTLTASNPNSCNGEDQTTGSVTLILPPPIDGSMTLSQTGICGELILEGELDNTNNMAAFTWFVDGEEVGSDPVFTFDAAVDGLYEVDVEIVPTGCNTPFLVSDTITLVSELPIDLGPSRDICYYESSIILENEYELEEATYEWQPGGSTSPSLEVTEAGIYTVVVQYGGCSDSRTVEIGLGTLEETSFEKEICEGVSERITVPVQHQSFLWENGATTNSIVITRSGTYAYTYIDEGGCEQSGEYLVTGTEPIPTVYIPNGFTPNGDGINDIFRPSVVDAMNIYSFKVYNRWGELVFETADPAEGWNGAGPGEDFFVPPGAYVYKVKYRGVCQSETIEETGVVKVIR